MIIIILYLLNIKLIKKHLFRLKTNINIKAIYHLNTKLFEVGSKKWFFIFY